MFDYDELCGRRYEDGDHDCFGLVRRALLGRFGIRLANIARPADHLQDRALNPFYRYREFGFDLVLDEGFQEGDVLFMSIRSALWNHCGLVTADGRFLHHLVDSHSRIDPLHPKWSHRATAVVRHPRVTEILRSETTTQHLHEVIDADVLREPGVQDAIARAMASDS